MMATHLTLPRTHAPRRTFLLPSLHRPEDAYSRWRGGEVPFCFLCPVSPRVFSPKWVSGSQAHSSIGLKVPDVRHPQMMCKVVLLALVGVACAASVEKRQGPPVAQARDGASHGSHGHSGGHGSSYAAPAPSSYDDGGSQGNLYYYYYPVSEYGSAEVSDGGFDVFAAVILPLLIIGGILLILSSLTFTLTNGRAMSNEPREASIVDELHDEIERVFYLYLNAFESEQCIQRTICQLGTYAKDFKGKNFVLSLLETLVPEGMKNNVAIFAKAAKSGYDTGKCKQFRCVAPKLLDQ